jgi:steroid delta-isomerase-like uncharacterized protein
MCSACAGRRSLNRRHRGIPIVANRRAGLACWRPRAETTAESRLEGTMGDNKTIARRWFSEVWAPDGEALVDRWLAPDVVAIMEDGDVRSPSDFKQSRRKMLDAFPDLRLTVEDAIEQGEKVVVRWSARGTHTGDGLGLPATNRPIEIRGMTWLEFRDRQVVRGWDSWNLGGMIGRLTAP